MSLVQYTPVCSPVKSCLVEDHCRRTQEYIYIVQRESERERGRESERGGERERVRERGRARESEREGESERDSEREWESERATHQIVLGNRNRRLLPGGAVAVCLICPGCACVIILLVLKKQNIRLYNLYNPIL